MKYILSCESTLKFLLFSFESRLVCCIVKAFSVQYSDANVLLWSQNEISPMFGVRTICQQLWYTITEVDLAHTIPHDRLPKFNLFKERWMKFESTHDIPNCKQLLNNENLKKTKSLLMKRCWQEKMKYFTKKSYLINVPVIEILTNLMAVKNLTVLSKDVETKCSDVCPLHANNSGYPCSKLRDQSEEEKTIHQMKSTTIHVKEESVDYKVREVEESCIHLERISKEIEC